jgi:hypothetical protein
VVELLDENRRRSTRKAVGEQIVWRRARERRRYGIVVDRSLDGFAFLTSPEDAPPKGSLIRPTIRHSGGRAIDIQTAIVRRCQPVTDRLLLVAAEIEA